MYNRLPFVHGIAPWCLAITLVLLVTSAYMKIYTQGVYEYNGGPFPTPPFGSVITSFDGDIPNTQYFSESFEMLCTPN